MPEIEFPGNIEMRTGESLSFTLKSNEDGSEVELVSYRHHLDPVREAAEAAALEQELEDL